MRTMARNKAAEALGVTPQTISNYVKEGILGGFIGIKNTLYVNADDVDKYLKKYRLIAVKEEMIDRKLREQKDRENEINDRLADTRKELLGAKSYKTPSAIILAKALRKFTEQTDEITANLRESSELEAEIRSLRLSIAALKKDYNDYRLSHGDTEDMSLFSPPEILLKPIEECGFSRRVISVLNCDKVYDVNGLVTKFFCLDDILKLRNIGRGSLYEIKIFIEKHGL